MSRYTGPMDQAARSRFVGETIEPVAGTQDVRRMARGEPGLPQRFRWRGEEYEVAQVLEATKATGDCTHGSGEKYVTRHRYRIRTTSGVEMHIAFDRRARTPRELREAWRLVSIVDGDRSSETRRSAIADGPQA